MDIWVLRKWILELLKNKFGYLSVFVELGFWNEEERRWGDYWDFYKEDVIYVGLKEYFMFY